MEEDLRLPAPRQCVERPIRLFNDDFSFLIDALDLDEDQTFTFQRFKDALFEDDWRPAESQPIEEADRKLKQKKQEQREEKEEKSQLLQETFREKLRRKVVERDEGVPDTWRPLLREIAEKTGLDKTVKTYEN